MVAGPRWWAVAFTAEPEIAPGALTLQVMWATGLEQLERNRNP